MNSTITNPADWRIETLLSLGIEQIHELARKANGTITSYRLVLGRCLLALHENKGFREFGCSGATHYGTAILGMSAGVARDSKRVARELAKSLAGGELGASASEAESIVLTHLVNHLKSQHENKRTRFGPDNCHTTKAQKQEIFRREGWCCATPGCCCVVWLEVHHIKPYSEGGKTVKENLLALCSAATATSIKACSRSLPNPTAP